MGQSEFKNIGIIGAGQMGAGIAQVVAQSGISAILVDINEEQIKKAKGGIEKSLNKFVEKEKITEAQKETALKNLTYTSKLEDLAPCDLVVEAIIENEAVKAEVFKKVDEITSDSTVLASNTSSIPITRLSSNVSKPENFIGMHFMNPVPIMKLVEVIKGMPTSDETANRIKNLSEKLGKEVSLSEDFPGFVVNRVLMPMINEAFFALMEGVASAEDIDKGMKLGCNLPMGPLTLADFIGLDTCLAIMKVIHDGTGDPKHRPCPLLVNYVDAGYYGRKTKKGVYQY